MRGLSSPPYGKHPRRTVAAALTVLFCLIAPIIGEAQPRKLVDLGGRGRRGMVRAAGRWVRDLAAADRVLVGVRPGVGTVSTASLAVNAFGGRVTRRLGGGRVLVVDLPADSDILAVAEKLQGQSGIDFAEPDRVVYTTAIPSDPEYANQLHLPKIKCPDAWDIGTGSTQVVIAVIDSGIDSDHPDLVGRLWVNAGEIAGNGVDDDGNGYIDDVNGWDFYDNDNNVEAVPDGVDQNGDGEADEQVNHGTLTAGLAAAACNGWGAVGVAWHATIMPVKVFPDDGTTLVSTVVDAMYYAVANGADIMNLSIGAPYEDSFTPPIVQLWNRGGLTVSAAGNDNDEITNSQYTWSSPACNNGTNPLVDNMNLGVGGLTLQDRKASWSNYDGSTAGNFVEVFAPGLSLHGPGVYYPSVPGFASYFTNNSGTSFSAPLVSGLAALLKAQDMNRTGADILQIIRSTCDNIDALNPGYAGKLGGGRINAARAMGVDLPPAPPTDVAAVDTPGDQGGSVTITWTKSTDDGGGSNTVTNYIVSRAQGTLPAQVGTAQSGWQDIATLAAGATEHIDETTTDGVDYYYRVAAIDATHRSESDPAGPVQSFDDTAPPRVETLVAQDHPLDGGGAIDLDWTGYAGNPDLVELRVYRDSRPFSTVAGMTPLVVIADPAARTYTDGATIDGADYYYAVTGVDDLGNERKDVLVAGPVQSFANGPVTLPAGLQMLGAPAIPLDEHPATLLGIPAASLRYARYDGTAGTYRTYAGEPIGEFLKLALGRGFWTFLNTETTITPGGTIAPGGNFDVALTPGWWQVANAYFAPFDFSASTVTFGGNTMDLVSADTSGVMRSYAWTYNTASGDYELVHPEFGATTLVGPWRGFWVMVDQGCTLTLARPSGRTASCGEARGSAVMAEGEWPLQIIARSEGGEDAANYCGVCAAGSGIESPPRPSGGLDLFFSGAPGARVGPRYATAFHGAAAERMTWTAHLVWDAPQGSVTLSWPDLSLAPHDYNLTLHDTSADRRISMRHQTCYVVDASEGGGHREFAIEASRGGAGGVRISALSVQPAGSGAQAVFTLSQPAACDVAVMNIAGRVVRALEERRVRAAGINTVAWDGRSSAGVRAPSGTYLMRVTARSDDGTCTSALRNLRIHR